MEIIFEILALIAVGWVSGAETGSWFGIQPVIMKLPYEEQLDLEKSMLRTFGRIMPVLMPFSVVAVIMLAVLSLNEHSNVMILRIIAAVFVAIAIISTVSINVPINNKTDKWKIDDNFKEWSQMRTRWHSFQGLRSGLYLAAFILLAIASTFQRHP